MTAVGASRGQRVLVVGAGATYAEAIAADVPAELRPPLMPGFARQLWREFNPHLLMTAFLAQFGIDGGNNAVARFIELDTGEIPELNVERFFAFAYNNRDLIAPGCEGFDPATEYENLLLHGILGPLTFLLIMGLLKPGPEGDPPLPLARQVAERLRPDDLVVNLNYDTVFELGAEQAGHSLAFVPNQGDANSLRIAKPHGSLNLFLNATRDAFWFAQPQIVGGLQPSDGSRNYLGFVPPRFGKQYDQHPIAAAILEPVAVMNPTVVTFWGIGLTDSDQDLLAIFRRWARSAAVEFINPSASDATRAAQLLGAPVARFDSVDAWRAGDGQPIGFAPLRRRGAQPS